MLIKISLDLKKEEIYAQGAELANVMGLDRLKGKRIISYPDSKIVKVHTFSNPVLMTDNYRISKLSPTLRDSLFSLFSRRPRTVEYDGVSTVDKSYHASVWCPSIDTVLFAKALKGLFKKRKGFKKAAEIGTGSGFLSKYVLAKNNGIKHFLVNDLNKYAIQCAMDNLSDKRAVFYTGDGIEKLKSDKYDLIICNPPYIPRPGSIDDNPYEGVGLLYDLVHNGQSYLSNKGVFVTNISSLCWDIIFSKKPRMKMKILDKMRVPLKVNNVLNNKSWIKYLEKRGLKRKLENGYEYWQTLYIVMFENA
jgi:hypothetical protein